MGDKTIANNNLSQADAAEEKKTGISKLFCNRKLTMSIIAGIIVLLAVMGGVGIFNTPANRLQRHLEMANKYLVEKDYERAIVEFDKAIEIEPMNVDAYLGKAKAYVGLDNYDMAIETLEAGYLATQEDDSIKKNLIQLYMDFVENSGEGETYEEKLKIYDRLIELDGQNEAVLDGLEKCLESYINSLLKEGKTDEVRVLIEKYQDILAGTGFEAFLTQIELRLREIGYGPLLAAMQELIIAENYDQANVLVQQQEYQEMIGSLQGDESYYYGEYGQNGERSGLGTAVYVGHYGAYFYYGSWSDGVRSGQGQAVHLTPHVAAVPYGIFKGIWENDLPNGEGEERYQVIQKELKDTGIFSLYRGTYKDGLYNGEMYIKVIGPDKDHGYRGTAENGVWNPLGEVKDGKIPIFIRGDNGEVYMWMEVGDNKDEGVRWLLPSTYWEEE